MRDSQSAAFRLASLDDPPSRVAHSATAARAGSPRLRRPVWLVLAVALAVLVAAPSASALIIRAPRGRHVGILPRTAATARMRALAVSTVGSAGHHHRHSKHAAPASSGAHAWPSSAPLARASVLDPGDPLVYHSGGTVVGAHRTYAIYWDPSGQQSFPSGYASALDQYLGDVAADSGGHDNVYSVSAQYGANGRPGVYASTYGGMLADSNAYPQDQAHGNNRGCAYGSAGPGDPVYGYCLTDAQIQSELFNLINQNGWPTGPSAVYFVFLPPGVDQCMGSGSENANNQCADKDYCAYHDASGAAPGPTSDLYAVIPYADVSGCRSGESPNGSAGDSPSDDAASIISHEHTETITDPLLSSWYDVNGNEIGDKCEFDYGNPLGGGSQSEFNQLINGHDYYLQQAWSNSANACAQRDLQAQFSVSVDNNASAPGTFSFDGGASLPAADITSYAWTFGDGSSSSGAASTVTHTYAQAGTYNATLTVTNAAGNTSTVTKQVSAIAPTASFSISSYGAYAGQAIGFNGSASSSPSGISSWTWSFGDGTNPTTQSGPTINHFFQHPGSYAVTLTVRDNQASTASVTHQVLINAPISSSGPLAPGASGFGTTGSTIPTERATGVGLARVGSAQLVLSHGQLVLVTGRALTCLVAAQRCTVTVNVTAQQLASSASTGGHRHATMHTVAIATATLSAAPGGRTLIQLRLNGHGAALLRKLRRLAVSLNLQARAGQGHAISQALSAVLRIPRAAPAPHHGARRG